MTLRISSLSQEGVYQGSKYLKVQVLCDPEELSKLFERFQIPFYLFLLTGLSDGHPIEPSRFLSEYGTWIDELKKGRIPSDAELKRILACALTDETQALWKQEVPGNRYLIKMTKPVVQIQAHFFTYSSVDGVFRPMTMGPGSIFWGLQFSFPQIYQNPKTMELLEVEDLGLFQTIRQWTRDETRATPFIVDGKRINVPIRLGKKCFAWIHCHPQLQSMGVYAG